MASTSKAYHTEGYSRTYRFPKKSMKSVKNKDKNTKDVSKGAALYQRLFVKKRRGNGDNNKNGNNKENGNKNGNNSDNAIDDNKKTVDPDDVSCLLMGLHYSMQTCGCSIM